MSGIHSTVRTHYLQARTRTHTHNRRTIGDEFVLMKDFSFRFLSLPHILLFYWPVMVARPFQNYRDRYYSIHRRNFRILDSIICLIYAMCSAAILNATFVVDVSVVSANVWSYCRHYDWSYRQQKCESI